MSKHKLIISSAGSGKTSFLVKKAIENKDQRILITTYTENNEIEIRKKFIAKLGYLPKNVTIQSWFSFLIQHGVKPFQGSLWEPLFNFDIKGLILVNSKSGKWYYDEKNKRQVYFGENRPKNFYFGNGYIFSDKLSKLAFSTNAASKGNIIDRISRIYDHIMIDEVQDLAGHDLELIKLLMKSCGNVTMVGDPRQVTYLTHLEAKNKPYRNGKIANYLIDKCKNLIKDGIDEATLVVSHRCVSSICTYSSKLYPNFPITIACDCCHNEVNIHEGVFLVKPSDVDSYLNKYYPIQLRWSKSIETNSEFQSVNFGESKGATFDRVLVYPTDKMKEWIEDNSKDLPNETRAKLYVGITRAKFSTAIVLDYDDNKNYDGMLKF
ncbi:UvrD-helicase domain-containing protein [Algoriphagus sp. NBT04N3]|jgi:DNA helicase II / ATP-dependent DNA helicase PcrA|uniref:UvrD-helicase domain-containing protein n=1 Tax=Algoriphagus sp. NBT04N3 TaxID=2705473 RepID=UPI001C63AA05|nr:UvrD-helicase domain-containing protein [Algoriphagus sp. NBT04N3]QYH37621.1 UvrD-helicase domain-containing protein [Algoriphagus sp. NBT04N3]